MQQKMSAFTACIVANRDSAKRLEPQSWQTSLPKQRSLHYLLSLGVSPHSSFYEVPHMYTTLQWSNMRYPTPDTIVANDDMQCPFVGLPGKLANHCSNKVNPFRGDQALAYLGKDCYSMYYVAYIYNW
jgi:hypothetical protein